MEEKERTVEMLVDDFDGMIRSDTLYGILLDILWDGAQLNYSKDGLRFNDEAISLFLRTQFSGWYKNKINELKKNELKKNEENGNE